MKTMSSSRAIVLMVAVVLTLVWTNSASARNRSRGSVSVGRVNISYGPRTSVSVGSRVNVQAGVRTNVHAGPVHVQSGSRSTYRTPTYHNTTHFDYHRGGYVPHRDHYQPGHYHLHRSGHWHR
jgi:hypothetical protein